MNISLEKGTTLIEYKETSQLLLVHVLLPLLFAGYIQIALVVGFPAIIVFLLNVRTKCSNQITTAVMFTLFYIQTENHFTSKVDNRRSLALQGSTTNECCSIYGVFLEISVYMQISYANCLARLPSAWLRFSGKKGNLSHVTIDPVLGTETIDYIIAKHSLNDIQILHSGCEK